MARATARVAAMQLIYESCAGGEGGEDSLRMVYNELRDEKMRPVAQEDPTLADRAWIDRVVAGVMADLDSLDARINAASKNWAVDRMARVDLAILRLAAAEIFYLDDIPDSVSVNEAVELAKKFGGEDSPRFVNGVLGKLVRGKADETCDPRD